ncbi:MAG: GMC family oxidoreductase N-terminal domain-containing protein [Beijerinckiaceae bacterium]|nr:GMC family oxidoreductase N-terminal domain-containing protein [Beijerinckiaceae bacterium]
MQYDYIIVGAGAAGCVLANRLTEDPTVRVALIEAGPDQNSRKTIVKMPLAMVTFMAPALAFFGGTKFMSWFQSEPEPGLQGRKIELPRGKGTGGSTNVNGQIFIRGQREDFDHWRDLGNQGWGYDDLLPYFKKVERFELLADAKTAKQIKVKGRALGDFIDPAYHGTDGPLNLAPPRSVNTMTNVYLEAAQQAGFEFNADFNGERQNGVGYYTFTHRKGERHSAEAAYIDPVRHRPNLIILSNRKALRVLLEGRRATGIEVESEGRKETISAKEIILSAGSFVSPHLLMLSGIGDRKELEAYEIPVVNHLPGVGKNLQDHLDITLEYKAKTTGPYGISWKAFPRNIVHVLDWFLRRRGVFASTTAEAGGFISTRPDTDRPDAQLFFCAGVANTQNAAGFTGHGFLLHITELRPNSIGNISLKSADPHEKPSIIFNFFRDKSTMHTLREGFKIIRNIVSQPAFKPHLDCEVSPGPDVQSDGAIEAFIRQTVGTLFHPVGTCSMGHGEMTVVDPASLRVHGIDALRVVDASVMPAIVSANTVAATYCLAEKAADLIKAEHKKSN